MAEIAHQILDKKSIIKQVIIAFIIGAILLVGAVLPAEYNIDLLGIGKATGFSKLYVPENESVNTGVSIESHKILTLSNIGSGKDASKPVAADNPSPTTQLETRNDEVSINVPAGKGLEYKVNMLKYSQLKYEWVTDNGEVYFDLHGEVKGNSNYFESYTIAYSNNMVGSFIAPFEGPHGWYFKNNSTEDIVVKLKMSGQYLLKP